MAPTTSTTRSGAALGGRGISPAMAIYEYKMLVYRRVWRASVFGRILSPVLFLLAMGVGLGSLVNRSSGGITVGGQVVPYLVFVVPAILAVQSMGTGMGESSWPVLGAIRWAGTYDAMIATGARVRDIFVSHLAFVATQVGMAAVIFLVVAAPFGGFPSWSALWCLPVSVLLGVAFAAPVVAFSAAQEDDNGFNLLFRLVQTPLMLFSGTFFPISQLPAWLQPLAWVTPLWHGVEANRALALGTGSFLGVAGHLAALAALVGLGSVLSMRALTKRLVT